MRPRTTLAFAFTAALIPNFGAAAKAACNPAQIGTADCPDYTAPAAMAVPGPSTDGSLNMGNTIRSCYSMERCHRMDSWFKY